MFLNFTLYISFVIGSIERLTGIILSKQFWCRKLGKLLFTLYRIELLMFVLVFPHLYS